MLRGGLPCCHCCVAGCLRCVHAAAHVWVLQAIALPTDFSAKLARNTQLILAEETGVTRVGE